MKRTARRVLPTRAGINAMVGFVGNSEPAKPLFELLAPIGPNRLRHVVDQSLSIGISGGGDTLQH
jgi:hypothetical protein